MLLKKLFKDESVYFLEKQSTILCILQYSKQKKIMKNFKV